jgi:hypothetical protein
MSEWQPIATAPVDELILVWVPAMNIVRVGRNNTKGAFTHAPGWSIWLSSGPSAARLGKETQPSHWMKLPDPPKGP